jgi:prevent-host-death family protein
LENVRKGLAMVTMETSKARKDFSGTLKAARRGERILLEKHGRRYAAIVSVEDLEALQRLEDVVDLRDARAAMRDAEENGTISLEDLKADLGL